MKSGVGQVTLLEDRVDVMGGSGVSRCVAEFRMSWSLFRTLDYVPLLILDVIKVWLNVSAAEKESDGRRPAMVF